MTNITTMPSAKIPTTIEEILLMDRFSKGEALEGVDTARLQMLIDHQAKGGELTLTFMVTKIGDDELKNKRIAMNNMNKRKL